MAVPRTFRALTVVLLVVLAGCSGFGGPIQDTTEPVADTPGGQSNPGSATPPSGNPATGVLKVHYINVGQASSTLVVTPDGKTMLIDTGDWSDDGQYVLDYLKAHSISRIDHLVATHSHADHIGGHAEVITYYETKKNGIGDVLVSGIPATTQTYQDFMDAVETYDVPLYVVQSGDTIKLGNLSISVLSPPESYLADKSKNENSVVLLLRFGHTSFLFPGDIESNGEAFIVHKYGTRLNVTVLQLAHHGSRTSTGNALLDATTPRVAIVSSAYDSDYGHPHHVVLERLAARDIRTYWTATHGNIVIKTDGTTVTVQTQQAAPTTATNVRHGDPISPTSDNPIETRITFAVTGSAEIPQSPSTTSPNRSAGTLHVLDVHADAAGRESDNLNDEYIVLTNTGKTALNLTGWMLTDAAGHTFTFPADFMLQPGSTVTIHTGSGEATATDLYWNASGAIWNNGGDTVTISDTDGDTVLQETYS